MFYSALAQAFESLNNVIDTFGFCIWKSHNLQVHLSSAQSLLKWLRICNQSTQQILSAAQYVPVYPTMQSSQQIDFDKFVSDVFIRFNHSDLQLFSCLFVKIFLFPYKSIEDEVLITVIQ